MKGLLIKDFCMVKKHSFFLLGIVALWLALSFLGSSLFFLMYSVVLISIIPINILAFDDFYKWNKYEVLLPVNRTMAVLEKYLLLFIFVFPTLLVGYFCLRYKFDLTATESLEMMSYMFLSGIVVPSVSFPLSFKLGYTKAKIANMIVTGIIMFATIFFSQMFADMLNPDEMLNLTPDMFAFAGIAVVILGISMLLSIRFYKKREF